MSLRYFEKQLLPKNNMQLLRETPKQSPPLQKLWNKRRQLSRKCFIQSQKCSFPLLFFFFYFRKSIRQVTHRTAPLRKEPVNRNFSYKMEVGSVILYITSIISQRGKSQNRDNNVRVSGSKKCFGKISENLVWFVFQ